MTMQRYYDRDRRDWRSRLYIFRRRVNALLALAILLAVLLPSQALAAPRCPGGGTANGRGQCVYRVDRRSVGFWPARVGGQRVTVGIRQGGDW